MTKLLTSFDQPISFDLGVFRAETLFTHFLMEHNVGLSAADHKIIQTNIPALFIKVFI